MLQASSLNWAAHRDMENNAVVDKENGASSTLKPSSKGAGVPLKQQQPSVSSRRPLGNITNAAAKGFSAPSSVKAGAPVRRALGDITNASVAPIGGSVGQQLPKAVKPVSQQPGPLLGGSRVLAQQPRKAPLACEDVVVERTAGKPWEQLEEEREAEEERRLSQRVRSLTSGLAAAAWHAPTLTSTSRATGLMVRLASEWAHGMHWRMHASLHERSLTPCTHAYRGAARTMGETTTWT